MKKTITPFGTVDQVFKTLYNVAPLTIFEAVYGKGHHQTYVTEKTQAIMRSPSAWWGMLDSEHQQRFCDFVIDRWRHQDD